MTVLKFRAGLNPAGKTIAYRGLGVNSFRPLGRPACNVNRDTRFSSLGTGLPGQKAQPSAKPAHSLVQAPPLRTKVSGSLQT